MNDKKGISANTTIPNVSAPKAAIFALWDALINIDYDGTSSYTNLVHSWTYGVAPNRVHVIHWFRVYHESNKASTTSQPIFGLRLYESGTKKFDVVLDSRYLPASGTVVNTSATIGCQNQDGTSAAMVSGSPDYVFPALTSAATDDIVFEFYEGVQPSYDLSTLAVTMDDYYVLSKAPFTVSGKLLGLGSVPVTSFTINYSVDGGSTVSANINGTNIKTGDEYAFTHTTKWTPANTGKYNIKVWASNLNGNPDENTGNDEKSKDVNVVDQTVQRLPLLEVFTSSTCGPCNPGNVNLHNVIDQHPGKYTVIKFQQDFPGTGDPYATTESVNRRGFYNINSIPRMEVDGGWDKNASSFTEQILLDAYNVPSFLKITATYKISGKKVDINAVLDPLINFPSTNLRAYVAIFEKLTTKNVKSNGETEFSYVMKKMVPSENGTTIGALTKGTPYNLARSWEFKGDYRLPSNGASANRINNNTENSVEEFTDLGVLVWVQDNATKQVLQSAYATDLSSIGENSTPGNGIIAFYPNPVNQSAWLGFLLSEDNQVSISVYNMLGKQVIYEDQGTVTAGPNMLQLNFDGFEKGMYVLQLKIGNDVFTKKFIVE